jgi:hypothetical protein
MNRRALWLLAMLLLLAGCPRESSPPSAARKPKPAVVEFPKGPHFIKEMSPAKEKEFVDKLKTLGPGDRYRVVLRLLGPPDSDHAIGGKGGPVTGRSIRYYLRQLTHGVNLKYDRYVSLIIDNDYKLVSMNAVNVEGLPEQITRLPVTEYRWNDAQDKMDTIEWGKKSRPGTNPD